MALGVKRINLFLTQEENSKIRGLKYEEADPSLSNAVHGECVF